MVAFLSVMAMLVGVKAVSRYQRKNPPALKQCAGAKANGKNCELAAVKDCTGATILCKDHGIPDPPAGQDKAKYLAGLELTEKMQARHHVCRSKNDPPIEDREASANLGVCSGDDCPVTRGEPVEDVALTPCAGCVRCFHEIEIPEKSRFHFTTGFLVCAHCVRAGTSNMYGIWLGDFWTYSTGGKFEMTTEPAALGAADAGKSPTKTLRLEDFEKTKPSDTFDGRETGPALARRKICHPDMASVYTDLEVERGLDTTRSVDHPDRTAPSESLERAYDRWGEQIYATTTLNDADPASRWAPTRVALIEFLTLMLKIVPAIASKRSMAVAYQYWLLARQKFAVDQKYDFGTPSEIGASELYTLACEKDQQRTVRKNTERAQEAQEAAEAALRKFQSLLDNPKNSGGARGNGRDGGGNGERPRKPKQEAATLGLSCTHCKNAGKGEPVYTSHATKACRFNSRKDTDQTSEGLTSQSKRRRQDKGRGTQGAPEDPKVGPSAPAADGGG